MHSFKGLSLILFKPITGKTHQIRIVSKNLSCPIVGDIKYNNQSKFTKETLLLNALTLKFSINNQNYEFNSELPINFRNFMKKCKLKFTKKNCYL